MMSKELIIHSDNSTLQLWRSSVPDQFELLLGTGGDFPEELSMRLNGSQLNDLEAWIHKWK